MGRGPLQSGRLRTFREGLRERTFGLHGQHIRLDGPEAKRKSRSFVMIAYGAVRFFYTTGGFGFGVCLDLYKTYSSRMHPEIDIPETFRS